MSEQKEPFIHTPGPWAWEVCDPSLTALGTSDGRGGVDLAREVLSVVRCKACQKDPEHRRCMMPNDADAKLIAAAPDLLEACVAFLTAYKTCDGDMRTASQMAAVAVDKVISESHANLPSE